MRRKVDEKTRILMEFFESQGFRFVDVETGERILPEREPPEIATEDATMENNKLRKEK